MSHPKRFLISAPCLVLASALAACANGTSVAPSGGLLPTGAVRAPASDYVQMSVPNIAGKYSGTVTESEGGHTISGSVTIDVKQSGSSVSGTFDPTINGRKYSLTFSGKVFKTAKGAYVKYTVYNPKGRNATGHATVIGKHLNGKAYVPPKGTKPAITITFKTVKE